MNENDDEYHFFDGRELIHGNDEGFVYIGLAFGEIFIFNKNISITDIIKEIVDNKNKEYVK